MARTSKQIQGDFYRLLKSSELNRQISGDVYRRGCRPRNSKKEDAIVIFTTGVSTQIQTGVVTINIYVPDTDMNSNGTYSENGQRCEEIERLADDWVKSLTANTSGYKVRLMQTIYTEEEVGIKQHFVVVKLQYRCLDE